MNKQSFINRHPVWFIIILTFSIRLISIWLIPVPLQDGGNFVLYHNVALDLLQGQGFSGENYLAPAWPLLMAGMYFLFGTSLKVLFVLQIVFGVLLATLTYHLAGLLFGRRAAFLSGTVAALWPGLILLTFSIGETTLLNAVFFLLGLVLLFRAIQNSSYWLVILSGLVFGAAALTDSIGLYLPAVIVIWYVLKYLLPKRERFDKKGFRQLPLFLVFIAVFAATIFPWAYRNLQVFEFNSDAPVIVKGIERTILQKEGFTEFVKAYHPAKLPTLTNGVIQLFFVPYKLDLLDTYTETSYKAVFWRLLQGQPLAISRQEGFIFILKIIISVANVLLVIMAFWGLLKFKLKTQSSLVVLLLAYTSFATLGYGAATGYRGISPLGGFLVPYLPVLISFAVFALVGLSDRGEFEDDTHAVK